MTRHGPTGVLRDNLFPTVISTRVRYAGLRLSRVIACHIHYRPGIVHAAYEREQSPNGGAFSAGNPYPCLGYRVP
jgi:hypothetical protein